MKYANYCDLQAPYTKTYNTKIMKGIAELFNLEQIKAIQKLNPNTDSKFKYDINVWSKLNKDYKYLVEDFENDYISRQDVIDAYKKYFTDSSQNALRPFLLTMIWGFYNNGYGTYRTNKYIESDENIGIIKKAIESDNLEDSFQSFNKIKGLGISYITKILYFMTKAKSADNYALIFDARVANSLIKLTAPVELFEIVRVEPRPSFSNYQKYNKLIHNLANQIQVEADQIELYLFNQEF